MVDIPLSGFLRRPAEPVLKLAPLRRRLGAGRRLQRGLAMLVSVVILAFALFGPIFEPFDPQAIDLSASFQPPSAEHWFGTDQIGRDVLSRVVEATRLTLLITGCVVALAGGLGGLAGIGAGYFGGALDALVMRLADIQLALPAIILAMVLAGAVGQTLPNLVLVLTLASWARFARVLRGEVLSLRTRDFILLVRLAGASRGWIMLRHILPNVVGTLVVLATIEAGSVIVLEATLSFLGLGIQPPGISWGGLIAEGRGFLGAAWWVCACPGLALMLAVLAVNLLGDALRDRLNPLLPSDLSS